MTESQKFTLMPRGIQLQVGQQFGRLTVVEPEARKDGQRAAVCSCSCGGTKTVKIKYLRSGRSQSCGCIKREQTIAQNKALAKRGGATTHPLWSHWAAIMNRCYNPAAGNYRWYGGRGISVCEEWRSDPWAFFRYVEQELGPRPSPKHSIDRIDTAGGRYEPGKIRWATPKEQCATRGGQFARSRQQP